MLSRCLAPATVGMQRNCSIA
jgi:hypothetical protein